MLTVKEVNETFAEKKLEIKLPYPGDWLVKNVEIVEKTLKGDTAHILLAVRLINKEGKELSEVFYGETKTETRIKYYAKPEPLKANLIEERESVEFENEEEAREHLRKAVIHLLKDKDYEIKQSDAVNVDIYGEKKSGRIHIYIRLALRSDDNAYKIAKYMAKLREKEGKEHDYCLVIPAMQESLGISLSKQEKWLADNMEDLYSNKICLFAVDSKNPNIIYPLTTYPREKELMKYFARTSGQWSMFYSQYMKKRKVNDFRFLTIFSTMFLH